MRKGSWKLIRYPKVDRTQLFNLAAEPSQAGRVKEMLALMAEQQKFFGDTDPLTVEKPAKAEVNLEFFRNPPARAQYGKVKPKKKPKRKEKAKN